MTKETGGPAFPFVEPPTAGYSVAIGMTLRDYFAAKAMQEWVGVCDADEGAIRSYKWADAMLKARGA